jgi:hypothetical protein
MPGSAAPAASSSRNSPGFRPPDRQQRDILLAALHATDMSSVDAHALGHRFLAEPGGETAATQVLAKDPVDIHP